ncbi:transporter substrate-binding domain-containing protein [Paraburkholderia kururiensis]|uniref:Transporter substrate-binding domain-containing protein n=1 Tax=Paraburkholderia kururiensis TaxID=984307 RepID=A0ABZ0WSZ2_9BURK|nr:transporter substrate-binding domain-containing protein [Paraburkholderia kururiensis]WQD80533.1 transporter substrate-binding domain-containing protein [Paraburkholderia kururiensis]
MKITLAYIEEPPFGWTATDGSATGADIDLATVVLRTLGVTQITPCLTTFAELLPGVAAGRWDLNVPLFVTPERMSQVDFSLPVWAIGDGLLVRVGNPMSLTGYGAVAARRDARLAVITGQVQHQAAKSGGVHDDQIVLFDAQGEAIEALLAGHVDAYASTALGNRVVAQRVGLQRVEAVAVTPSAHEAGTSAGCPMPMGAFSFRKGNAALRDAFNRALRAYLGSAEHRRRMAAFGLTAAEIDPIVDHRT